MRCQRQDLTAAEVRAHLKAGKVAHQVALTYEARVSFVLAADLTIRRVKFEAVDEFDANDETDPVARFDANFAFMTAELSRLTQALHEVFAQPELSGDGSGGIHHTYRDGSLCRSELAPDSQYRSRTHPRLAIE